MAELKLRFEQACIHLNTLTSRYNEDALLYVYGRYKQATVGRCNTNRPGLFDFSGKRKWDAWNSLGDLSSDDAMRQYIQRIEEIDPDWQYDPDATSQSASGWVTVSTLCSPMDEIPDKEKTIWDWCQLGDLTNLKACLSIHDINIKDASGMTLLHWASDRGHIHIVEHLITCNAEVSVQDNDGQTPLHYAASCGHAEIVRCLLAYGANKTQPDADGLTPGDVADSDVIKLLL